MSYEDSLSAFHSQDKSDLSKLESKLSLQKNSATLNLTDCFIGDQGCSLLSTFIHENPSLHSLELRGNSISSEGLRYLSQALQQQNFIRSISLEWNNIGDSLSILLDSLSYSVTIESLDFRNNKIGIEGASALARFLETNSSVVKVDLRWNEIGTIGAQRILQVLPRCKNLKVLEVSGNKIAEDVLVAIESLLFERGRDEPQDGFGRESFRSEIGEKSARKSPIRTQFDEQYMKSEASARKSPMRPVYTEEIYQKSEARKSPARSQVGLSDELYAKYEVQMINNARNEAKINELEILLSQENRRNQDLKSELYKEIEAEKSRRAYTDQTLMVLKEESLKRDMDNQRFIQELENKLSTVTNDKNSLAADYENLQSLHKNTVSDSQICVKGLEEKLAGQERQNRIAEENFRALIERQKKEYEQSLFELTREFQAKLESAIDVQNSLRTDKDVLDSEIRGLRSQIVHIKSQAQISLTDLEYRLKEEEEQKLTFAARNYESRIQILEDSRENLNKRLQDLQRDFAAAEKRSKDEISSLEHSLSLSREEKTDLSLRFQKLSAQRDSLQNDLQVTRSTLERAQSENSDLSKSLKERKEAHTAHVEKLCQDQNNERKASEAAKDSLMEQLKQLEAELNRTKRDRDRVIKEHEFLNEALKQRVSSMIQETVQGHMRKVGDLA